MVSARGETKHLLRVLLYILLASTAVLLHLDSFGLYRTKIVGLFFSQFLERQS